MNDKALDRLSKMLDTASKRHGGILLGQFHAICALAFALQKRDPGFRDAFSSELQSVIDRLSGATTVSDQEARAEVGRLLGVVQKLPD